MLPSDLTLSALRFIFLQSQDNLASKIVGLLTFATVSKRTLERLPKQRYNSAEVRHLFKRITKVVKELENFSKSEVSEWDCSLCLVRPTRGR